MALKDDLTSSVKETFRLAWTEEETDGVPEATDLKLAGNHAKQLEDAIVLYADIDGSTSMVDTLPWSISAEIYKTYLHCASRIIRDGGGTITAYDGDRVMAVWPKNHRTAAVKTAMKINYAVVEIIRPAFVAQYSQRAFVLKHVVGIDLGTLHAARIGVRGDNDIVWVGRAANHAAKLCNKSERTIWITKPVHEAMDNEVKYSNGNNMWESSYWFEGELREVYSTNYWWRIA